MITTAQQSSAASMLLHRAKHLEFEPTYLAKGMVTAVRGPVVMARLPQAAIGDMCSIECRGSKKLLAQIVGFDADLCSLAPFDDLRGMPPGANVFSYGQGPSIRVGDHLIGQVIDPSGAVLTPDSAPESSKGGSMPLHRSPPNPLLRRAIREQLYTGIRSLDFFCPIGYGQRLGIFSEPGVGKSTLLGMLARNARADVAVIGLIGERGREVQEFLSHALGATGLLRSVVVVATSDEPPLRRVMAAQAATTIAEYFRDRGKKVLLMIDSLTRTARAIRDVSLAAGELPLRQGFTPSVYAELPRLIERSGAESQGSITALYTVLTQHDSNNDALAEEVKSLLDGHICLDAGLASQGVRPAVDILRSISRLRERLLEPDILKAADSLVRMMNRLSRDKDILLLGGVPDQELKSALELEPELRALQTQAVEQVSEFSDEAGCLKALAKEFEMRAAGQEKL